MKIKVKLFGMLADTAKQSEMVMEDVHDTESLRTYISVLYPAMNNTKYLIAINKKVMPGTHFLQEEDEIALLPPFSGG